MKGIKTGGRQKGSVNKKTQLLEGFAVSVTAGGMDKFLRELKKLEGKQYVDSYLSVYEYVRPKLARTELTGKDGGLLDIKQVIIIGGKEMAF